jgi:N-acetylmuramoyl-L-alanine amidase
MLKGLEGDHMLVCLDAGHGMDTEGKRTPEFDDGTIIHEAEQNYPVMFKVAEYLEYNEFNVVITNENIEYDMPLGERTDIANESEADIFISIHKNAISGQWQTDARGIETFVIQKGYEAERLANGVQEKLIEETKMLDRGVKEANFHVLRETNMPAILVELGFMDYREEAEQMLDETWHERFARAITKGVCEYAGIEYKEETIEGVETDHWAEEDFNFLNEQGITVHQRRFDEMITRGEVISLLARVVRALR